MALKLPDSAVPMGDFPVAKAVDIDFNDGENLQEKFDNGELGGGGNTTDITDLENRVTTNETNITDLENRVTTNETNITDLENRVTTNETNITDLQEQIDNLDIPEDVDLTEINTKLTQLETKQINKICMIDMVPTPVCYKITPKNYYDFSNILIVDLYGGCLLITGSMLPNYKSLKAVRLSNGCWESYSPSNNVANKIESVYYDVSYIYVNCIDYIKINFEGGFTNIEKIDSLPTGATQLPILDLTQGNTTALTDLETRVTTNETKLTQLENTINEVGGGGIYQSGEIEVGTWTGGQKLYRYTISDNTQQNISDSGVLRVDFFTLSRDKYTVVKLDGTFRMCAASDNSGAHTVYTLPYVDLETNRQVHLVYTTMDKVRLSGVNLTNYKILGFDVSIYYYKK